MAAQRGESWALQVGTRPSFPVSSPLPPRTSRARRGALAGRVEEVYGVWRKNGLRPAWGRQRGVLWEASLRSPEGGPREAEWAGGPRAGPAQVAGLAHSEAELVAVLGV